MKKPKCYPSKLEFDNQDSSIMVLHYGESSYIFIMNWARGSTSIEMTEEEFEKLRDYIDTSLKIRKKKRAYDKELNELKELYYD